MSSTVFDLLNQHSTNPVKVTGFQSTTNKPWTKSYPAITKLNVHTTVQGPGHVVASYDSAFLEPYDDDNERLQTGAYPPNYREWRLSSEEDGIQWFHTEVSNIVLAAFGEYPTMLQASHEKPLSDTKFDQTVDVAYPVKHNGKRKHVTIGEFKRGLILPDQWQDGKLSAGQKSLSQELRGCQGEFPLGADLYGYQPSLREFYNGRPLWNINQVLYWEPWGHRRVVDASRGAFYWTDENGSGAATDQVEQHNRVDGGLHDQRSQCWGIDKAAGLATGHRANFGPVTYELENHVPANAHGDNSATSIEATGDPSSDGSGKDRLTCHDGKPNLSRRQCTDRHAIAVQCATPKERAMQLPTTPNSRGSDTTEDTSRATTPNTRVASPDASVLGSPPRFTLSAGDMGEGLVEALGRIIKGDKYSMYIEYRREHPIRSYTHFENDSSGSHAAKTVTQRYLLSLLTQEPAKAISHDSTTDASDLASKHLRARAARLSSADVGRRGRRGRRVDDDADDIDARIWTYVYNADVIKGVFLADNQNSVSLHGWDLMIKHRQTCSSPRRGLAAADASDCLPWDALSGKLRCRLGANSLGGHAFGSFKEKDGGHMWLRDALPFHLGPFRRMPQDQQVLRAVYGIAFFGVPHYGMDIRHSESGSEHMCAINCTHSEMVKFGRHDADYDNACERLRGLARRALTDHDAPTRAVAVHRIGRQPSDAPHFFVPVPENKRFVGREDVLASLRGAVFDDGSPQTVPVVRLGGIGKTQVVLQMAYYAKTKPGWSVFWLPGLSMASFEDACTQVAEELSLPRIGQEDAKEFGAKGHIRSGPMGLCKAEVFDGGAEGAGHGLLRALRMYRGHVIHVSLDNTAVIQGPWRTLRSPRSQESMAWYARKRKNCLRNGGSGNQPRDNDTNSLASNPRFSSAPPN
ncbi:hypothetical protein AK830_g7453 [Neonectria ditissima]|uniref:Uncharacterized protein n=1 Tax=Neonectria ditissima TaxID=78410 RepID=A0A0P7BDW5_9HYPO|nr:hypothetical protein AK830_g7453 [Neonectria ditissima]